MLILVVFGVFLLVRTSPAAAGPPVSGGGQFDYIALFVDMRTADGNTFFITTEEAAWFGAFSGTSSDACTVVVHASGAWFYKAIGTITGTVGVKSGTLEFSMVNARQDAFSEWQGTWVILNGTDELENPHGQWFIG
jgi:hypothetical protein